VKSMNALLRIDHRHRLDYDTPMQQRNAAKRELYFARSEAEAGMIADQYGINHGDALRYYEKMQRHHKIVARESTMKSIRYRVWDVSGQGQRRTTARRSSRSVGQILVPLSSGRHSVTHAAVISAMRKAGIIAPRGKVTVRLRWPDAEISGVDVYDRQSGREFGLEYIETVRENPIEQDDWLRIGIGVALVAGLGFMFWQKSQENAVSSTAPTVSTTASLQNISVLYAANDINPGPAPPPTPPPVAGGIPLPVAPSA
jgi:hypothetical protein